MEVSIYYHGQLGVPRGDVEVELETILKGQGVITGGGSGVAGGNIDLEIDSDNPGQVVETPETPKLRTPGHC
jgi:hypothetical protein